VPQNAAPPLNRLPLPTLRDVRSTGDRSRGGKRDGTKVRRVVSSDLNDAVEVGAEEQRGGTGGPRPLDANVGNIIVVATSSTGLGCLSSRGIRQRYNSGPCFGGLRLLWLSLALIWCGDGRCQLWRGM
jgi:hypothetical protein